ncbi:MAG: HAD family hydrolase [Prevotella sp.]|nr:HAD family hydrolase [Prevotella sp.]
MKDIRGIIFDYGGTIDTDGQHWGMKIWHAYERRTVGVSEADYRDAYVAAERALGRTPLIKPDYTFRQTLSIKLRLQLEHLCTNGRWDADEQLFNDTHAALLNDLYEDTRRVVTRNKVVLEQLGERFPMVLVSNFYGNLHAVLREFALDGLFKQVVESAVVGVRKPDARIFQLGVDALQLPASQVLSVGDSFYKDVEPSQKVGCRTVWLKGEGWTSKEYDESIPDFIIHSLSEVEGLGE